MRALVRHQRGQSHDLVRADHLAVARSALYRLLVLAVFRAPPLEDLVVIVESNRKLKVVHVLARLDLRKKRSGESSDTALRCRIVGKRCD